MAPLPFKDIPDMPKKTKAAEAESDVVRDLPAPEATTRRIRIDTALCAPVPLYVHGVGHFALLMGETYDLPPDAISALENVEGLAFTFIED